jgi:predicted phosphodiesterase
MSTVLVIGDTHFPFQHKDMFEFLETVAEEYQPDEVVQVGDLIDIHSCSRHDADPDGSAPGDELELAITGCEELSRLFPEMKIVYGNHDLRFHKAAYRARVPAAMIKGLDEVIGVDGWEFAMDHIIDEVLYTHGTAFGGETGHVKAVLRHMRSVVMGHTHTTFGVEYVANRDRLLFGVAAGCLVDHNSYSMAYAKEYPKKPLLGAVVVEDGILAKPIPMVIDRSGSWIGRI